MSSIKKVLLTVTLAVFANSQQSLADPIEDANSYAVRVKSSVRYAAFFDSAGTADGAGFLVDKKRGLILSNAHVAGYGTASLEVSFKGEKYQDAQVLYVDTEHDVAILGIPPRKVPEKAVEAKLDCSDRKLNGAEVAAFGHPEGLTYSASRGIVSQVRVYDGVDWVQTDAAINPGNSGGPLIDLTTGSVVGINAMALKDTEGLNFAVPIQPICKIIDLYNEGKNPQPPLLPFTFATNEYTEEHVIIAGNRFGDVPEGFKIGDRVTAVNKTKVKSPTEIFTLLRGTDGEALFTLQGKSGERDINVTYKFEEGYLQKPYILLDGALIAEAYYTEMWNADKMYQVHSVRKGSYADKYGILRRGMIVAVDGEKPRDLPHLQKLLNKEEAVNIVFRVWSSRDQYLYDFFEVEYESDEVTLMNAM
jgi:serine protease Do